VKADAMLLEQGDQHAFVRAKALAEGIKDAAAELRLIDVADFITYIRSEQFANIEDLVNSSVELFFKERTLSFGWAAELDVKWGSPPVVRLDMEFRHKSVSVFFNLTLRSWQGRIDIHHISFENSSDDPDENTRRLIEAIADARLPPRGARRCEEGAQRPQA
jgi:hypothetical protein